MQHFSPKDFKGLYKYALIKPHKQPEVGDFLSFLQEVTLLPFYRNVNSDTEV